MRRIALLSLLVLAGCQNGVRVGEQPDGTVVLPTAQVLAPIGEAITWPGRPVDMALSHDRKWIFVKDNGGLVVIDRGTKKLKQRLSTRSGASHVGIVADTNGAVYVSDAANSVHVAAMGADGNWGWVKKIDLPKPSVGGAVFPCGMALSGTTLYVCASRSNAIVEIDTSTGAVGKSHEIGISPYTIQLHEGGIASVSCWGGSKPKDGAKTAESSGSQVEVDDRGIAKSGSIDVLDLRSGKVVKSLATPLEPSGQVIVGNELWVACANSDVVVRFDTKAWQEVGRITTRPSGQQLFGSMPNALAKGPNERIGIALGGNNALGIWNAKSGKLEGLCPTGWYPGSVLFDGDSWIVANIKGTGSRERNKDGSYGVYSFRGTVTIFPDPRPQDLAKWSQDALRLSRHRNALRALERGSGAKPKAVPTRLGEPSLIEHVVYIIKENRTYDQVFGDLPQGDGDPKLTLFGREVTPNHHALAEQFVLLDNYYCNGVNSADGHAWSVEGMANSFHERSFGGWTRSYPYGDDPISYASTGFIWNHVLAAGLSFRNYGEFDNAEITPKGSTWKSVYDDFQGKVGKVGFTRSMPLVSLRPYSHPHYPGWNMRIPDVVRAQFFLDEFKSMEKEGNFPNFSILYLPQDHTSGTSAGEPTPRATVADNDLALGKIVEAISRSKFWAKTVIFVIEDDPQNGFDHVDGHRSLCLVIGPYVRRGAVVSELYNQTSVILTMLRILGVRPMNQLVAQSNLMVSCFTDKPDLKPYVCLPNNIPLDELNPSESLLTGFRKDDAIASRTFDLSVPDRIDQDRMNLVLWRFVNGSARYPSEFAGAHGTGLKDKGLMLDSKVLGEDKDD
ncbi:MAG: hypothetical protein HONBIEJF_00530 [Fimbriimonadaceae bacterium]|nr:hypothetical protein [Fimbriimonadaceae bacterium]